MDGTVYIAVIVFLFILLVLGWSKQLFWFLTGISGGAVAYYLYESEGFNRIASIESGVEELRVSGVYSLHKTVLVEVTPEGIEKQLVIQNIEPKPPKDLPEYGTDITRPCYDRTNVDGKPFKIYLTRRIESNKNRFYGGKMAENYYLAVGPKYTKRGTEGQIIGTKALMTKSEKLRDFDKAQNTDKHAQLLEKTAKLLHKAWCGENMKDVVFVAASKQHYAMPDQGALTLLSNVKYKFYHLTSDDYVGPEEKKRGFIKINYDDEVIRVPVIEHHPADQKKVLETPFVCKIHDLAEHAKLVVILQDYISSGVAMGKVLPKNVIYVGRAMRIEDAGKLYLNAFVNPLAYNYLDACLQTLF